MTPVLEKILEKDPDQEEARLALASQYIRRRRWPDRSRRVLTLLRSVTPHS